MNDIKICSLCGKRHSDGHSIDRMYKSRDGLTPIHIIRDFLPGFVGGCEIAEKARDEEIIILCDLKSEIARLRNELKYNEQRLNNVEDAIKKRRVQTENIVCTQV